MSRVEHVVSEYLWCLNRPKLRSIECVGDYLMGCNFDCVLDWDRSDSGSDRTGSRHAALYKLVIYKWSCTIMHCYKLGDLVYIRGKNI